MKLRMTVLLETELSLVRAGLEMQQAVMSIATFTHAEVNCMEEVTVTHEDSPAGILLHITPVQTVFGGTQNIAGIQEHCPACGRTDALASQNRKATIHLTKMQLYVILRDFGHVITEELNAGKIKEALDDKIQNAIQEAEKFTRGEAFLMGQVSPPESNW